MSGDDPEADQDPCVEPQQLPSHLLPQYSMQSEQFEAEDIKRYVEGQARDEEVLHVEFIKEERAAHAEYRIWDVHTDKSRWWVITNMTNLYSQEFFPSLDYTISFHIGLMARLRERDSQERDLDGWRSQFAEIERRQSEIHEAFDHAKEAVEFQRIGLMLREVLLKLVASLSEYVVLPKEMDAPRKGDFKAWASALSVVLFNGRHNQPLRKFVRDAAEASWELSNWLTHAQNADGHASLIAMQSVDNTLGNFLFALVRHETGDIECCPICKSRRLRSHFDINLGDEGEHFSSCGSCGWSSERAMHA